MMEVLDEGKELPIDIKDCTIITWDHLRREKAVRSVLRVRPQRAVWINTPRVCWILVKKHDRKGKRTKEVIDAVVRNKAVYFAAIGGAGALLSKCIKKSEIVCYEDLGAEAIRKIEVEDFPVIVVVDSEGNNLYETAIKEFAVED